MGLKRVEHIRGAKKLGFGKGSKALLPGCREVLWLQEVDGRIGGLERGLRPLPGCREGLPASVRKELWGVWKGGLRPLPSVRKG